MRFDLGGPRRSLVRRRRAKRVAANFPNIRRAEIRRPVKRSRNASADQLMAGGIAALLFAGLAYILASPGYEIVGADIRGNDRTSAAVIYAVSGLDGRSVFSVDVDAASERIMELPDIDRATVAVRLPHHVSITVDETEILLLWRVGESSIAIDSTGRVITPPASMAPDAVPTIYDESATPLAVGAIVPVNVLDAALAYGSSFGSLIWDGEGFATVGGAGWRVRLGADASLAAHQRSVLDSLIDQAEGSTASIQLVDLRFPSRPFARADLGAGSP